MGAQVGEWREVPIGELAEIYDGPHATPSKTSDGPVFLGISNLAKGRIDLVNSEHLSEADFTRWTRRVEPQVGDVVFSYETRLGEAAIIPSGLRCCLGRRMGLLRARPGKVDKRFLLYAYLGPQFQETLRSHTIHGSTVDRIPLIHMPSFPIEVPASIAEQRAIAHILGTLDDKIELNRRMNETLEVMARALFKSWFVDFDPVRAKAEDRNPGLPKALADLFPGRLVDSELGEIPEGWEVDSIYKIANVIYGAPFASSRFNADELGQPLIRIRDLAKESPGVWTSEEHAKGYKVRPGDVVVGMDGEFRAYLWGGAEAWLNQRVCVFVPKGGVSAAFVRNSIIEPLAQVEAMETATTVIHLGKGDIDRFSVVVPTDNVQSAFNENSQPCYERIIACKQASRALAALRDALLPELISGALRVKDAERFIGRAV